MSSTSDNIHRTRYDYMKLVFETLKKVHEERVWSLLELAHHRGHTVGSQFATSLEKSNEWLELKAHLQTMFDFVSPVECYFLLTGKTTLNKPSDISELKNDTFGGIGEKTIWALEATPEGKPTKESFVIGPNIETFDPNLIQPGESADKLADHKKVMERRTNWRLTCGRVFETIWASSTAWGFILERGFANETTNFKDVGIDFVSDILVKARSRGFLYSSYYTSKMLGQDDSSIADELSQAVMLFVSPAELYEMLSLTLEMKVGTNAKPYDPRRVKLA